MTMPNLPALYVWVDTIFLVLYVFVWLFLIWHFTMFVIKGRFRKAFIEGNWPEHEARPPAAPKIAHGIHMIGMIILGITGMLIRFPVVDRTIMRDIHYVLMIIVIATVAWRIWYAFRSKTNADWREFAIGRRDLDSALGVLAYYGYVSDSKPHVAKYNVMQKMSYNLFLYMMIAQAITGLLIWRLPMPIIDLSFYDMAAMVVGATGIIWIRLLHYILNWGFIIMMTVHAYLAFSVDVPCMLDFFGIKEMPVNPDAHGHGHGHGHDEPEPALEPTI